MKKPKTPSEWRKAVDAAHGALSLEIAREYGLVTGGPIVHVDRCEAILSAGRELGYIPQHQAFETFIHRMAKHYGRGLF